jgi:hypothetical protein
MRRVAAGGVWGLSGALGAAAASFGKYRADQLIQPCAVRGDGRARFRLFAGERGADVDEASLDATVDGQRPTQQCADARIDFSIQLTSIGAGNLDASELSRASRGHVFAP